MEKKLKRLFWRMCTAVTWHGLENCRLMELTSSPQAPKNMTHSLQVLVKRIRYKFGSFEYAAFEEHGKVSGMKHLHLITFENQPIPWQWISNQWQDIHNSRGVYIRKCYRQTEAAHYAIKYAMKEGVGRTKISQRFTPAGVAALWSTIKHVKHNLKERLSLFGKALRTLKHKLRFQQKTLVKYDTIVQVKNVTTNEKQKKQLNHEIRLRDRDKGKDRDKDRDALEATIGLYPQKSRKRRLYPQEPLERRLCLQKSLKRKLEPQVFKGEPFSKPFTKKQRFLQEASNIKELKEVSIRLRTEAFRSKTNRYHYQ